MKKIIALVLALAMVLCMAACGGSEPAAPAASTTAPAATTTTTTPAAPAAPAEKTIDDLDPIEITMADNNNEASYPSQGLQMFMKNVTEKTNGKITWDFYPNSALGGYVELTENMAMDNLDAGELDPTLMTEYCPEFQLLIQPFIIMDADHFKKVLNLPAVKDLEATLDSYNIHTLGYMFCGFRSMCTQTPITCVADCAGIVIRSPEADIYMNTLKRLGMSPTPMAMSEMYPSMKAGIIQGAEPAVSAIWDNSLYEVCPCILHSNHMASFNNVVFGTNFWNSLDPLYQEVIEECIAEAQAWEFDAMTAGEQEYYDKMEALGCTITEWANYQELVDLFAPTWDEAAASIGGNAAALLEAIKAAN